MDTTIVITLIIVINAIKATIEIIKPPTIFASYKDGVTVRPVQIKSWVSSLVSSPVLIRALDFHKSWVKSWIKIQDQIQDLIMI